MTVSVNFHIWERTQYSCFCAWLISLNDLQFYIRCCKCQDCISLWQHNIPLCIQTNFYLIIHPSMDPYIDSSFDYCERYCNEHGVQVSHGDFICPRYKPRSCIPGLNGRSILSFWGIYKGFTTLQSHQQHVRDLLLSLW